MKSALPIKAAPAKKSEGFRFLFPGPDSWELWNRNASGAIEPVPGQDPLKKENRWNHSSFLAVPVQYTVFLTLWLATRDRSLMGEMIWLQLERKGLINGTRDETVMDYRVVREEEGRSLLSVSILSESFPEELNMKGIQKYPLVTDLLPLSGNQMFLWKELGHLVFVFTAEGEVVYVQAFPSGEPDQNVVQDALCTVLQLQSEAVFSGCTSITAWGSYTRQELEPLGRALGAPVLIQSASAPALPSTPRNLTPFEVRQMQEKQRKSGQAKKGMMLAAVLYLVFVAVFLGNYGWLFWKKQKLQKQIGLHASEVQTIRGTAQRWESMELAIIPETYPVEMLYRCTRQLPEDGVRLVTFDQAGTRILMTGEAKSSSAAFQFLQDLKKSKDLAAYQWEMPPPKLLPNDAAQFQIEGKRSYAPTDNQ